MPNYQTFLEVMIALRQHTCGGAQDSRNTRQLDAVFAENIDFFGYRCPTCSLQWSVPMVDYYREVGRLPENLRHYLNQPEGRSSLPGALRLGFLDEYLLAQAPSLVTFLDQTRDHRHGMESEEMTDIRRDIALSEGIRDAAVRRPFNPIAIPVDAVPGVETAPPLLLQEYRRRPDPVRAGWVETPGWYDVEGVGPSYISSRGFFVLDPNNRSFGTRITSQETFEMSYELVPTPPVEPEPEGAPRFERKDLFDE